MTSGHFVLHGTCQFTSTNLKYELILENDLTKFAKMQSVCHTFDSSVHTNNAVCHQIRQDQNKPCWQILAKTRLIRLTLFWNSNKRDRATFTL